MNFAIYKYIFKKSEEKNLYTEEGENVIEKAQELFGELLKGKQIPLSRTKKEGEVVVYKNEIIASHDDIFLMRVCNVKNVKLVQDYKERTEESNPWCYIIIDNRKDVAQIAIEKSSAFAGEPDKVRDILQENIGKHLHSLGINLEINAKMRQAEFWEIVDNQCNKFNDRILRISFSVVDFKETNGVDCNEKMKQKLLFLSALAEIGAEGFQINAGEKGSLRIDRTQEDIAQLIGFCCNNGYRISVHFANAGIYRYGENVRTFYNIDEQSIQEFAEGQPELDGSFKLASRLDYIREITKNYDYEKKTPKRRKRSTEK